ncbi:flagellar assembly protein FliW [Alkalihalobacterium sp. APHAB7]|uniref:flagellar assembly protein FliW n=1 Tax=Alkalihalobacterium sp. APHAB7 TaxID=3402081 RepID=UPI003AAD2251
MKINTKFKGEVEVSEEKVIHFENGLPAFEEETQFVLLPFDEGTPFYILQSTKTIEVAFILVNPFHFFQDYSVKLSDGLLEKLAIEQQDDVAIFSIVTVKEPFTNSTVNLQGPIIINAKKQKGKQYVMAESEYGTSHMLFQQQAAHAGEGK